MTKTEFLGLSKREPNDKYSLKENNDNLNKIDLFAQTIATGIAGIPTKETGKAVALTDASDMKLKNLVIYGNTTQNGTPTPENPIDLVSVENPVVTINGKNLLENNMTSEKVNGLDIVVNADKSITVNGTSTASFSRTINSEIILPTGKYTISGGKETNARLEFRSVKTDGSTNGFQVTNVDAHTTITDDVVSSSVIIVFISGTVFDNFTFKPMIRLASITDSTYEPYKGQSLSVPYTLSEGDFVDYGKGVIYRAETQMETPLTAEELEAFKTLHSYYPTTTITNSENAEMGVEYFADTKIYIDNKFAEINRAILNNI